MNKRTRTICIVLGILLITSLSCNLPFGILDKGTDNSGTDDSNGKKPSEPLIPILENKKADPKPVSFQEALGSFDSYKFTFHFQTSDSSGLINIMDETVESNVIDGNSHTTVTSTSREAGETESTVSTSEIYNLGTITCSYSDGEWGYSERSAEDKEITDAFSQMIDFTPVFKDPVFVAEENVNGIQTNHFTFKVPGIGEKSGANATTNQGEYWLAIDGQFIVKYTLTLQIQSAPDDSSEAKTSILEVGYNLLEVNQPLEITQPVDCVKTEE